MNYVYIVWRLPWRSDSAPSSKLIGIRRSMESANTYAEAAKVLYPFDAIWVEKLEVEP